MSMRCFCTMSVTGHMASMYSGGQSMNDIERLQLERANAGKRAIKAEEEVERLLDLIDQVAATLRNDLYSNRVRNALSYCDEARDEA